MKKELLELSHEQLRQRAKARGLLTSGKKSELVLRLMRHEAMLERLELSCQRIVREITDRSKIAAATERSHGTFISRALYENV